MKKVFYVIFGFIFYSCGNEQPVLNGTTPFVVTEIRTYNETHASYYGEWNQITLTADTKAVVVKQK